MWGPKDNPVSVIPNHIQNYLVLVNVKIVHDKSDNPHGPVDVQPLNEVLHEVVESPQVSPSSKNC